MSELINQISSEFKKTVDSVLLLQEVQKPVSDLVENINRLLPFDEKQGDIQLNVSDSYSGNDLFFISVERWDEANSQPEFISQLTIRVNTFDIEILSRKSRDEESVMMPKDLLPKVEKWILVQLEDFLTLNQKIEFLRLLNEAAPESVPSGP